MSSTTNKNFNLKKGLLYAGLIVVLIGILVAFWTQFSTVCGFDQYQLQVCLINPVIKTGAAGPHLYDGTNPINFFVFALVLIVIGLASIYLGIESNKSKTNPNKQVQ